MKRILYVILISLFVVQAGFSGMWGKGNPPDRDMHRMPLHQRNEMMDRRGDMGFLIQVFDLDGVVEKYKIEIEQVYLEVRKQKLELVEKRKRLYQHLMKLLNKNIENPKVQQDFRSDLQALYGIQKQISKINREAMEKIRKLYEDQEKEMYSKMDIKMKDLGSDSQELKDIFNKMKR